MGKQPKQTASSSRGPQSRGVSTEPTFIEPMQAKPVAELPPGEQWTFEIKFDGYRCIAVKLGSDVTSLLPKQENL